MYIGGILNFCQSYKPSEPLISLLHGEWYDEKKTGQMEFMPVKGFQFWLLWFAVFQGDCGHSWKGECLWHCDRRQSLSHCRRVTRRCQVKEGVLLGSFVQCRSDPATHGRAWETLAFSGEKRGFVPECHFVLTGRHHTYLGVSLLKPLRWRFNLSLNPRTATLCGCEHAEFKGYFRRHTKP